MCNYAIYIKSVDLWPLYNIYNIYYKEVQKWRERRMKNNYKLGDTEEQRKYGFFSTQMLGFHFYNWPWNKKKALQTAERLFLSASLSLVIDHLRSLFPTDVY